MINKNIIIYFVIFALMILPSFAQDNQNTVKQLSLSQKQIEQAIKNYQKALENDNPGMTESAIINIMSLKYYYPQYDYQQIVNQLEKLEEQGLTKSIKFMSYIVKNYILYPERYAWIDKLCCEKDQMFYAVIAEKVHVQVNE